MLVCPENPSPIGNQKMVVPSQTLVSYITKNGGEAVNVIPDNAESRVNIRHPSAEVVRDVFDRVQRAAEGAALGTGTTVDVAMTGGVHSILPNDTLGKVMQANMLAAPPITWSDTEVSYAETIQESMHNPPGFSGVSRVEPYEFNVMGAFSSDVGDVSWISPCAALTTVTWVPGTKPHTWQAVAAGGMSIAHKGLQLAATVLATTAANLLKEPQLIAHAKAELAEARGKDYSYRALADATMEPQRGSSKN